MVNNIILVGESNEKLFDSLKSNLPDFVGEFNFINLSRNGAANKAAIRETIDEIQRKGEKIFFVVSRLNNNQDTENIVTSGTLNKSAEYLMLTSFKEFPKISIGTSGRIMSRLLGYSTLHVNGHNNVTHSVTDNFGNMFSVESDHNEIINPIPFLNHKGTELLGWSTFFRSDKYSNMEKKDLPIDFLEPEIILLNKRILHIEYDIGIQTKENTVRNTYSIINNFINS